MIIRILLLFCNLTFSQSNYYGSTVNPSVSAGNVGAGALPAGVTISATNVSPGFNGVSQMTQMDGSGNYPAAGGAAITGLNASNLGSGTISNARLPGSMTTTTLQIGSGISLSSAPISHIDGSSIVGTLISGTTFQAFIPDSAITLRRLCTTVNVAGIAGSGDTVKCNDSTGNGVSVVISAAATAGTVTCGVIGAPANIAYQSQVSCHLDSGAATRPIFNMALEYTMQ